MTCEQQINAIWLAVLGGLFLGFLLAYHFRK